MTIIQPRGPCRRELPTDKPSVATALADGSKLRQQRQYGMESAGTDQHLPTSARSRERNSFTGTESDFRSNRWWLISRLMRQTVQQTSLQV
ncbi:MAG: hypothetical protein ACK56I_14715, partial [bacterium]